MSQKPERPAILLVDDDPDVLDTLGEQLVQEGYDVTRCLSPVMALDLMRAQDFAVILSDQHMPGVSGHELLGKARVLRPRASRILITGVVAADTLINAVNTGEIFRFIAKPWARADLVATVGNAVQRHRLLADNERLRADTQALNRKLATANAELCVRLDELTQKKDALDAAHEALETNFEHSLGLCYRIIATFYPLLGTRTKAVVEICRKISELNLLPASDRHILMTAAWLHDIGLIGVRHAILQKLFHRPADLTPEEWTMIHQHPAYGQTLAAFVDRLTNVGTTIRAHHERFDGKGYPDGLIGTAIPWPARLLSVAVGAVESGLSRDFVGHHLLERAGTEFDPEAVRIYLRATQAPDLPRQVRECLLHELRPGMRLAKGIFSPAGLLLVPEGQELTEAVIADIKTHELLTHPSHRLLVYR
jgi:response regulator RpfG family c-di-GMP phosphodiesterase